MPTLVVGMKVMQSGLTDSITVAPDNKIFLTKP
jgi:hypothetical protein